MEIVITDAKNTDFIKLTRLLDQDLNGRYGKLQANYNIHNKVDMINCAALIYDNDIPIACGAYKKHDSASIEIKRIYVIEDYRRQGLGKRILKKLENHAKAEGYLNAKLETGKKQYEAIELYKSIGYQVIDNFPPYIDNSNSLCMKKGLCKPIN